MIKYLASVFVRMHLSCSYLDWVLVFRTVVINTHLMDLERFRIYILSKCHLKMSWKEKQFNKNVESRIRQDFSLQLMFISNVSPFCPLRHPPPLSPRSVTLEKLKWGCYDSQKCHDKVRNKAPICTGDAFERWRTRRRISGPTSKLLVFSWAGKIHLNPAELILFKLDVDISNILSSQLTLCLFAPLARMQVGHWKVGVINWGIKKVTRHWDVYIRIYTSRCFPTTGTCLRITITELSSAETNRQNTCRSRADKSGYKMGADLPLARRPPPQRDGCLCVSAETVAGIIAPPVQVWGRYS